jgi:Glycosyl transferase family 2
VGEALDAPVVVWAPSADEARLHDLIEASGAQVDLVGLAPGAEASLARDSSLFVVWSDPGVGPPPADFSVVAFVTAFNEADVVASAIDRLTSEGAAVHLIDNWSTDGTWEIAQSRVGRGLIGVERFPADGPSPHFELRRLLRRVEELAATTRADWCLHIDADERRRSPWQGVPLRDALWRVDRRGFNAVDHTVLTFSPVDDGFRPGSDPEQHFRHFEFGRNVGHLVQIKAWKRSRERVELASTGGHDASFAGRRVFPYNFLLKHYPVRSQAHGETKVFAERLPRWSPEERAAGWHVQYDHVRRGHSFLRDPASLEPYDDEDFARRYLVERLSRIGIPPPTIPPAR